MWHICVLYPVWFAAYLFHFAFANAVQQWKKSWENNKQIWKNLKCFTFQLKCLQMRSCFYKAGQYLIYAICKSDTSAASARRTSKSWSKLQTLKTAITTSEDTRSTQMLLMFAGPLQTSGNFDTKFYEEFQIGFVSFFLQPKNKSLCHWSWPNLCRYPRWMMFAWQSLLNSCYWLESQMLMMFPRSSVSGRLSVSHLQPFLYHKQALQQRVDHILCVTLQVWIVQSSKDWLDLDMLPAARLLSDPSGNFPDASTSPPCPLTNCNCCAHTVMEPLPGNVIANVRGTELQPPSNWLHQAMRCSTSRYGECKWRAYNTAWPVQQCARCWHARWLYWPRPLHGQALRVSCCLRLQLRAHMRAALQMDSICWSEPWNCRHRNFLPADIWVLRLKKGCPWSAWLPLVLLLVAPFYAQTRLWVAARPSVNCP